MRLVQTVGCAVMLFGAFYCWRDGLVFGGFAWLTLAVIFASLTQIGARELH